MGVAWPCRLCAVRGRAGSPPNRRAGDRWSWPRHDRGLAANGGDWELGGGAGSFGGSFLLGAGVAVGWTPCIGPTLGAILTLAAASPTVWAGAALLVAYAIGMAVPLAIVGLGLARVRPLTLVITRHHRVFQVGSGLLIVVVGSLVATNSFGRLAGLVPWPL
jgi:cytochrome c-type biogenesis protein